MVSANNLHLARSKRPNLNVKQRVVQRTTRSLHKTEPQPFRLGDSRRVNRLIRRAPQMGTADAISQKKKKKYLFSFVHCHPQQGQTYAPLLLAAAASLFHNSTIVPLAYHTTTSVHEADKKFSNFDGECRTAAGLPSILSFPRYHTNVLHISSLS